MFAVKAALRQSSVKTEIMGKARLYTCPAGADPSLVNQDCPSRGDTHGVFRFDCGGNCDFGGMFLIYNKAAFKVVALSQNVPSSACPPFELRLGMRLPRHTFDELVMAYGGYAEYQAAIEVREHHYG